MNFIFDTAFKFNKKINDFYNSNTNTYTNTKYNITNTNTLSFYKSKPKTNNNMFKTGTAIASLLFAYNILNNKKRSLLLCDSKPEIEDRFGKDQIQDMEKEINLNNNNTQQDNTPNDIEMPDLPMHLLEDENAMQQIQTLIENPELDPEAYKELMNNNMSAQPPPFKQSMHQYKINSDDRIFSGIKLSGEWNPVQNFKVDLCTSLEKNNVTNKVNIFAINQDKYNPQQQQVFIGRLDPSSNYVLQSHFMLSPEKRFLISAIYPKCDQRQSVYELEYAHSMDRLNGSVKLSNQGNSASLMVNAGKDAHMGIEIGIHPKTNDLLYSYGVLFKPIKKLGVGLWYISHMPAYALDACYIYNRNAKFYFNFMHNKNPMLKMQGMPPTDLKIAGNYKEKEWDALVEYDYSQGSIGGSLEYRMNNYFTVSGNIDIVPLSLLKKSRGKPFFKNFGLSVNGEYKSMESLANVEEDFSEYEYDNL